MGINDQWKDIFDNTWKQGQMNYNQFISAAIDHKRVLSEENIKAAFNLFNPKKGEIDLSGFKLP